MTPDVNVLVAAARTDHPHHAPAREWLIAARDAAAGRGTGLALLPMVAVGFVRVVTSRRAFVNPTNTDTAFAFIRALLDTPGVTLATLGREWSRLVDLSQEHSVSGGSVTDAWIAAAVLDQYEHLVTFDRDFLRLLPPRNLTVLTPPESASR